MIHVSHIHIVIANSYPEVSNTGAASTNRSNSQGLAYVTYVCVQIIIADSVVMPSCFLM